MEAAYLAIALLVLGLTLIVCEVFIPSAGLIAIFATLCFAGSVVAACDGLVVRQARLFRDLRRRPVGLDSLGLERRPLPFAAHRIRPPGAAGSAALDEVTPYQEEQRQLQRGSSGASERR